MTKTNAYIENLNYWEQKLQKLQGQNERVYRKSKLLGESELFEASKQKLQKLQGQNEHIYQKSILLGESLADTTETTGRK